MNKLLLALLLIGFTGLPAHATAQFAELIRIDGGEEQALTALPLEPYLKVSTNYDLFKRQVRQDAYCTALWRNYVGHWAIQNRQLYLTKLETEACSEKTKKDISLTALFPDRSQPILADWYSGDLVLPQGKMLEYVHMGYASRYEKYLIVKVVEGKVVSQKILTDKQFQRSYNKP